MEIQEMGKDNILIRDANQNDARGIFEVTRRTWLATYPNDKEGITKEDIEKKFSFDSEEAYEEEIRKREEVINTLPNIHFWVALDNQEVVGYIMVRKKDERNIIQSLYVLPEYQKKGLGRELMEKATDWLGNDKDIALGVVEYNEGPIKFYEKMGFKKTGKEWNSKAASLSSGKIMRDIEMVREKK